MRWRTVTAGLTMILALSMFSAAAMANSNGNQGNGNGNGHGDEFPEHPHVLLLHAEIDVIDLNGGPTVAVTGYQRCVDLANGQSLPLNAHHDSVHFGTAGEALQGAGHRVLPGEPFWDDDIPRWADCDGVDQFLKEDGNPIPLPDPVPEDA
jgi:hypothetical protein